jgi:hypothetical protein
MQAAGGPVHASVMKIIAVSDQDGGQATAGCAVARVPSVSPLTARRASLQLSI